ncbi:MAG: 4-hydroxy-tetrahydrodipicolinate synthase [Clostridia bacterium]|nr:4-hydroxy-tetrahydrodipicolinate synthase [Clostridia bacterium]
MKQTVFKGAGTALCTPFSNGLINYEAYDRLLDFQLASRVDAVIVCGTTGEGSTLTDEEHRELIAHSVKYVNGRIPVIAGTGSNDTAYAVDLSKYAESAGADALLQVTPYYNKASQSGLVAHFGAVAEAVNIPIILYNVPSRTGTNIKPETLKRLAGYDNIVAVKEASGDISQVAKIRAICPELDVYSGNDDQTLPVLSLGGKGVISVLSNIMPDAVHDMCEAYFNGDTARAEELQLGTVGIDGALFSDVNPIMVKTALAYMGLCSGELRLPLTPSGEENNARLLAEMKKHGLVK